jgi:hypothetical protein
MADLFSICCFAHGRTRPGQIGDIPQLFLAALFDHAR